MDAKSHSSRGRWTMIAFLIVGTSGLLTWTGCRTTPVTGRKQLLLIPEQQEIALGLDAYNEIVAAEPVSKQERLVELVNRVGIRIAAVAGRPDYQWEFRVIESGQQNAFALPGGKVAIYEGILPICQNEAGLAVVMSHEIAHALARHGGERMSQSAVSSGIERAIAIATRDKADHDRQLLLAAYGAASKYGIMLPYSREHESEADRIGLMLMAQAGYDPREAPEFWRRFGASTQGEKPAEFLSTHPSDERRAAELQALLPQALTYYEQAAVKYGFGETIH